MVIIIIIIIIITRLMTHVKVIHWPVMHSAGQQMASTVMPQVPACVAMMALGSARPPPGQSSDFRSDEVYEKYSLPPVNDNFHCCNIGKHSLQKRSIYSSPRYQKYCALYM